jgi:hypothetical protein
MAADAAAVRGGHIKAKSILLVRVLQSFVLVLFAVSYVRAWASTRE